MFVVNETEAAAIRAAYDQGGEFMAGVEVRRLFPGIIDNAKARECARIIAGWSAHSDRMCGPVAVEPAPVRRRIRRV